LTSFKPRVAQPGDTIRSEDWNYVQQGLLDDLSRLEADYMELRKYVDNMSEIHTITQLESPEGKAYALDEKVPGESGTYETKVLGFISKQWLPSVRGAVADICRFTVTDMFDQLDYWAGAENGNTKALDIAVRYVDGSTEFIRGIFVHERKKLASKGVENPYVEFLLAPNQWVWYRYRLVNPRPDKEVLNVTFKNSNVKSTTRVADTIQLRTRIRQLK
jgi:hypothetical protein